MGLTVIFFMALAAGQLGLFVIGDLAAGAAELLRAPTIAARVFAASLGCAIGGFAGAVVAYGGVIAIGLMLQGLQPVGVAGQQASTLLGDAAPWILLSGYLLGIAGGGTVGWVKRS
jgi:hypothetical protein